MLYLILSILLSALIAIIMRYSERYTKNGNGMLIFNYVMCIALSACFTRFSFGEGFGFAVGVGALNGVLFLSVFMLLKWNISRNGVILPSTFQRLGVIIPTILSIAVFGEKPNVFKVIGFLITIAAIVFMNGGGERGHDRSYLGLIAMLCIAGITDAFAKVYEHWGNPEMSGMYLFVTFCVAFIVLSIIMLVRHERIDKWCVVFGLMVGVPNFFSARCLLNALAELPALIVYPTYAISILAVLAIAGIVLFHEKLSKRQWISLGGIAAALVLLNI